MKNFAPNSALLGPCLALLFAIPICHAEIYKWVDSDGRTHYSEQKEDAGKTDAQTLKLKALPRVVAQSSPSWQEQEKQFLQRQAQKDADELFKPQARKRAASHTGNEWDETTDAGRCNLARDILNGLARHLSGAPVDKHDRDIAENDVRTYCH